MAGRSYYPQRTPGSVQLHVSVRAEMDEFVGWQPEQVAAFCAGIAEVLSVQERARIASATVDTPVESDGDKIQ